MKKNDLLHRQIETISSEVKMEMDLSAAMVEKIETILALKGITHRELANRIGCDESQIFRWTRGFPNYTFNAIARISCALGEPLLSNSLTLSSCVSEYNPRAEHPQLLNEPSQVAYGSTLSAHFYRHFRNGKIYRFVAFATLEATEEEAVVYQAMYGERRLWIRTKANFFEAVLYEGKMVPRFQPISNEEAEAVIATIGGK